MALTEFTKALGTQQGRTQPKEFTPHKEWSFTLGHERSGEIGLFDVGDSIKVGSSGEFVLGVGPRINLIRYRGQLRAPTSMPPGRDWKVSMKINGVVRASRLIGTGGAKRPVVNMAANVSDLGAGAHTLEFVLEVV